MKLATLFQTTKAKVISIGGASVVAVGIGAAVLLQGSGYRTITVEQITGIVNVVGEKNNGQAYTGERLNSGDDVSVMEASELTMCMDGDKYVYADANTHFVLEASGKSDDAYIRINLDAGSELNVLENKLSANDKYEVDTPNSTMSVRGTRFRVTVFKSANGLYYTLTEVEEGEVLIRLKTTDGSYNGVEKVFTPGQSALIRGNSDFSEFVTTTMLDQADLSDENAADSDKLFLAYDSLPEDGMERLIALLDGGGLLDDQPVKEETVEKPAEEPAEEEEEEEPEEETEEPLEAETEEENPEAANETVEEKDEIEQLVEDNIASIDDETGDIYLKDGTRFDPDYYARNNPDVVSEFGDDPEDLLAHYLIFGKDENRPPSEEEEIKRNEKWKEFDNMLAEAEAERKAEELRKQETAAAAASNDNNDSEEETEEDNTPVTYLQSTSTSKSASNIPAGYYNGATGAATLKNSAGKNVSVTITSQAGNNSRMRINGPGTFTLPASFTATKDQYGYPSGNPASIQSLKRIDWDTSASGVTVNYSGWSVTKNSNTSYVIVDTNSTPIQTYNYSNTTFISLVP